MSKNNVLDDLRAYVSALADDTNDAVETPTALGSQPRPVSRRLAVAAAAAAVAVVIGAIVQVAQTGDGDRLATGSDSPSTANGLADSGPADDLEVLPDPPLDVRGDMAVAWSGEELVVWGGDVEAANMGLPGDDLVFADGAAYDPATKEWRLMSPSPLPGTADTPVAAATDDGVVLARGTAVALWDPATDTWRELPDAPAAVTDLTWTGRELVSASANAVLPMDADAWTQLDPPPFSLERPTTAWTGSELVVVGGPSTPFTPAVAIALDPEIPRWRTLPDPPDGLQAEALAAAWDGNRVVVVNYDMQAVSYNPSSDTWTRLAPVPARFSEWYPRVEAANGYSVAFMAHAAVVLRPDDTWLPLPYDKLVPGITTIGPDLTGGGGPVVYSVGLNVAEERNVVTAMNLAQVNDTPPAVQVGAVSVKLPDGFTLTATTLERGSQTSAEAVTADLVHEGKACVLTSAEQSAVKDPPLVVEEALPETPGVVWRRNEDATTWATRAETDRLLITCDSPDDARLLAGHSTL